MWLDELTNSSNFVEQYFKTWYNQDNSVQKKADVPAYRHQALWLDTPGLHLCTCTSVKGQ